MAEPRYLTGNITRSLINVKDLHPLSYNAFTIPATVPSGSERRMMEYINLPNQIPTIIRVKIA